MEQTHDIPPAGNTPEEPDRLQVAAEISLSYPELSESHVPGDTATGEPAPAASPPVLPVEPIEAPAKTCPQCKNAIPIAAHFCRYCRQPFEVAYQGYCETCHGLVIANENGACSRCGGMVIDLRVQSRARSLARPAAAVIPPRSATPLPVEAPSISPSQPYASPTPQPLFPATYPAAVPAPVSAPGQYDRPGSYIDRRLRPGEQILYRTRLHWTQLSEVVTSLVVGIAIFGFYDYLAAQPASLVEPSAPPGQTIMDLYPEGVWFCYLFAFLLMLSALFAFIRFLVAELAITDQRLLGRYGMIGTKLVDIALADISLVKHGRFTLPNQGSITLACVPRRYYVFRRIPRPKEFRQRLEAALPAVRPPVEKVKWWRVLLITLGVLLVIAAGLFIAFYFTGGRELMQPVVEVNFSTISLYPQQRRVTIEGYLELPLRVHCDDDCGVRLVDYTNPELTLPVFISVPEYGEPLGLNQMEDLPTLYDYDDFRVRLNDGTIVGDGAAVRLIGHICQTVESYDRCISGITLIEQGNPPQP